MSSDLNVHRVTAVLGLIAAVPVILFVSANVLVYELEIISDVEVLPVNPAVLVGGAAAAVLLNGWSILEFRFAREDGRIWLMCGIHVRLWNLAVLAVAGGCLVLLLAYVIAENLANGLGP